MVVLFLVAQFVGLYIVNSYIDYGASQTTGTFTASALPDFAGQPVERPDIEPAFAPVYIGVAVLVGTLLLFVIIKWVPKVWKFWFFLAITTCLHVAFFAFLKNSTIAFVLAVVFAGLKVWKPSTVVHNFTELLLYGGMVSVFFTILNIKAMIIILVLISVYDAYAVWKSKHMVTLAKFQTEQRAVAGLMIPYGKLTSAKINVKPSKLIVPKPGQSKGRPIAILGGGDIAFPLLTAAAVLKTYALTGQGWLALIIPPCAAISLLLLLVASKKGKFYPAMPFISAGCFVGLFIVWLSA